MSINAFEIVDSKLAKRPQTRWTDDERELLVVRARQILRDDPDIAATRLFAAAQDVIPNHRRRAWPHPYADRWLTHPDLEGEAARSLAEVHSLLRALEKAVAVLAEKVGSL